MFAVFVCLVIGTPSYPHPMWGIAVDSQGRVYFSDLTTVWRIDADGKLNVFRPKGDGHVHELSVDPEGNVYGAENTYDPATKKFFSAIWKMAPDGESDYIVPRIETPPSGSSVWRDLADNTYYTAEYPKGKLLVLKRTGGGLISPLVGEETAARNFRQTIPYGLGGMAFGAEGSVFFVHGANISKISTDGRHVPIARNVPKEAQNRRGQTAAPTSLYGIAIDGKGDPVVADYGNQRVFKVGSDGKITTLVRAESPWYPTGVSSRGNEIYILEVGHTTRHEPVGTRVRKLAANGSLTELALVTPHGPVAVSSENLSGDSHPENINSVPSGPKLSPVLLATGAIGLLVLAIVILKGRKVDH